VISATTDLLEPAGYAAQLRAALARAYVVLGKRDWEEQRKLISTHLHELLGASVVRVFERENHGGWRSLPQTDGTDIPAVAREMEAELLPRAFAAGKSLLSTHPVLDPDLADLAARCSSAGITTHVLLVRAEGATHAAFAAHWLGCERAPYDQRVGFYLYWDTVGIAVSLALERRRAETELRALQERAFRDPLTGLPNAQALEDELGLHASTFPFGVVALDFDGLREANAAFGYEAGGDRLIRVVGGELARLELGGEFVARMNTAGDEFVLLLPGADEPLTTRRASEVEAALDALAVPTPLGAVYRGASVGFAQRRGDESPGQTLGRALESMRERKHRRRHGSG